MDSFKCTAKALLDFYEEDRMVMEVIDDIEKELSAENKVVCQFMIDGKTLTTDGESVFQNSRLSEIKHIEYIVTDIMQLVVEVAEGWIGAIEEQTEPVYSLAQEMVDKPTRSTYKKLDHVFHWCSEFVESLTSMKIHRTQKIPSQVLAWDQLEGRLSVTVRALLTNSEKKDFKAVAYALEYDLVDILHCWSKELEKFIAEIRGARVGQRGADNAAKKSLVHTVGRARSFN
ncbi:MAG: hypothetical protein V4736_09610 [Bdellovibrionota bacterium]